MKFQVDLGEENMGASVEATPTELDGFPLIEKLTISRDITSLSPDRCLVASILTFAPYLSGQQIFPSKFSSLTAELSQRLLEPIWSHFSPLHPGNVPIPRGSREVALKVCDESPTTRSELRLIPSTGESGVGYQPGSIIVSTNALDIDVLGQASTLHPSRAALAVAVLLAEDLDVATYVVSQQTAENFGLQDSVLELLNAVSIGVHVEGE